MDIDLSSLRPEEQTSTLVRPKEKKSTLVRPTQQLNVISTAFPRAEDGAAEAGTHFNAAAPSSVVEGEVDPVEELAKRQARAARRGAKLRSVLGDGGKYVIDLGEYKRKKVKVFVQFEGFASKSVEASRRLRVAITIPPKWVDAPVSKLKETFLDTYNKRQRPHRIEPIDALLSVVDTRSYLTFAKSIIADDAKIGDSFHENDEIFVLTATDVENLDDEVRHIKRALEQYEDLARKHRTVDPAKIVEMTTVSRQIDPYKPHILLIGMKQFYMLPVEASFTVADIKSFIHFKGGPDRFPLGSIDIALLSQRAELNVLADDDTVELLAKRVYGDDCTLLNPDDRKVAVPLYWGKRLQDPKYFFWTPSLHSPDSFVGSGGADGPEASKDPTAAAKVAQQAQTAGGDCTIA